MYNLLHGIKYDKSLDENTKLIMHGLSLFNQILV